MGHPEFLCVDCKFDTWENEYYMVHDRVWRAAGMSKKPGAGMLCIGCLEQRLGRTLTPADFTSYPINHGVFPQSDRLRSRIHGTQRRTT